MVDDEIDRNQRIDLARIAAERRHRVTHRREIDDGGHAGEVLHEHARRPEGDFVFFFAAVFRPGGHRLDVLLLDGAAVLVAQQILDHDFQRERQLGDACEPVLFRSLEREDVIGLGPDGQRFAAFETVEAGHAEGSDEEKARDDRLIDKFPQTG